MFLDHIGRHEIESFTDQMNSVGTSYQGWAQKANAVGLDVSKYISKDSKGQNIIDVTKLNKDIELYKAMDKGVEPDKFEKHGMTKEEAEKKQEKEADTDKNSIAHEYAAIIKENEKMVEKLAANDKKEFAELKTRITDLEFTTDSEVINSANGISSMMANLAAKLGLAKEADEKEKEPKDVAAIDEGSFDSAMATFSVGQAAESGQLSFTA